MAATIDTVRASTYFLRDEGIPTLEASIASLKGSIETGLDEVERDVQKKLLFKMETIEEFSCHILSVYTLIVAQDMTDTTGERRLTPDKIATMDCTLDELNLMCKVPDDVSDERADSIARYMGDKPGASEVAPPVVDDAPTDTTPHASNLTPPWIAAAAASATLTTREECNRTIMATCVDADPCTKAAQGAGVCILAMCIGYAVYRHYKSRDPNNEYANLLSRIKGDLPEVDLGQIFSDMEVLMGPMRGCHQLDEEDRTCCVCLQEMSPCPHPTGATHDDLCAVLPYQCRHPICSKCSYYKALRGCPLCTEPRNCDDSV